MIRKYQEEIRIAMMVIREGDWPPPSQDLAHPLCSAPHYLLLLHFNISTRICICICICICLVVLLLLLHSHISSSFFVIMFPFAISSYIHPQAFQYSYIIDLKHYRNSKSVPGSPSFSGSSSSSSSPNNPGKFLFNI